MLTRESKRSHTSPYPKLHDPCVVHTTDGDVCSPASCHLPHRWMFSYASSFSRTLCGAAWVSSRADKVRMFEGSPGHIGAGCPGVVEPGHYCSGTPLQPLKSWLRSSAKFTQLDQMSRRIKELEKGFGRPKKKEGDDE